MVLFHQYMVRGNPANFEEAKDFLDDLVRETFMFTKDHAKQVMSSQPDKYDLNILNYEYSLELTDYLIQEGIISKGFKVVLSGPKADPTLSEGSYTLVVYETTERMKTYELGRKKNVELAIHLSGPDMKTMEYAIASYDMPAASVFFEDAKNICEFLINDRKVSIDQKYDLANPSATLKGLDGKELLDDSGKPIPKNLFSDITRDTLASQPANTIYKEIQGFQISCFSPKE